jgi:DNA-directed RNA polymerase subunit RPC12/RpoP
MNCPYCGQKTLNEMTTICTNCGKDLAPIQTKLSRGTAPPIALARPDDKSPPGPPTTVASEQPREIQSDIRLGASIKQMTGELSSLRSELSQLRVAQDSLNESLKKILERLDSIEEKL